MYSKIDKIVNEIVNTEVFKNYSKCYNDLYREDILLLLSRHSMIQDDYFKMKQYTQYINNDDLYNDYKKIKSELMNNDIIKEYYKSYYEINEMLEDVTQLLFNNISDDLTYDYLTLGSKI